MKQGIHERGHKIWTYKPPKPQGPVLAVVGSMHGDERFGAQVIQEVLSTDHPLWKTNASRHTIHFIVGNPDALELNQRTRNQGLDLNRLFGEEGLSQDDQHLYENNRVNEIKAVLHDADVLIDLHQTSCPSPPVAVIPQKKEHRTLARALGIKIGVLGAQETYGPKMISDWFNSAGKLGITIETGQIGTQPALECAREVLTRFLSADWSLCANQETIRLYQIREHLTCPGASFEWVVELGNTSHVQKGDVLGTSREGPLHAPFDCATFLPQIAPRAGAPCVLLADDLGERPTWSDDL